MRSWRIGGLCVAIVVLTGCAAHPLDESAVPDIASKPPSQQTQPSVAVELPEPTGDVSLREAMALAVARNPALTAFSLDVRRAEARALQAGLWSNPELEVEFENFAGDGVYAGTQSLETTVSLAQTFPLGGDLDRRRELARHEVGLANWDYEAARLSVLTEVTQRYVQLVAAQRRVAVAQQSVALAEHVQRITQKRIEAGDAPAVELARSSLPVAMAKIDLRRADRALATARLRLAATWGSSEPTFANAAGSLDELREPPAVERLVALINTNPQVARWATQISAHEAERKQAEAAAVPDITGRLGYRHDRAEDAGSWVVGISLPLPIFDRAQGDALAARLGSASARQRQREAELRIGTALSEAWSRMASAHDEAVALRDDVLSLAEETFDVTRQAFERGDVAYLDVIDAERTLIELRVRHLEALIEYHIAVADLEGLIGRPLDELETKE